MLRRTLTSLILTVSFSLFFSRVALSQDTSKSISGTLIKSLTAPSGWALKSSSGHLYNMRLHSDETNEIIQKLEDGDFVSGAGEVDHFNKLALLKSIDFIGLKKFLGLWWTSWGFAQIPTFSELSFSGVDSEQKPLLQKSLVKRSFQYSISPTTNPGWIVLLSDDKDIYFSSLHLNGRSAHLKIYNAETGTLTKVVDFTRISL